MRPFVCEGSPLECRVFVVGLNPATELEFWPYWSPETGFDKQRWYEAYLQNRNGRPSGTRKKIESFVQSVRLSCLETNIYAKSTKDYGSLRRTSRTTAPFDFLLDTIQPRAMLVHGADAVRHLQPHCDGALSKNAVCWMARPWGRVAVLGGSYLSRFWNNAEIQQAASTLTKLAGDGESPAPVWLEEVAPHCFEHILRLVADVIVAADDPTPGLRGLDAITTRKHPASGRTAKAFNSVARADGQLFTALMSGEHALHGFTNGDLRTKLAATSFPLHDDAARQSAQTTRLLDRLHLYGLVAKIPRSRRWRSPPSAIVP